MKNALIGFTGFVGSSIASQQKFEYLYNSKNIDSIKGEKLDLLVCAGVKAEVWKANQNPEEDLSSIENLISHLEKVETKKFVLISTVDVYDNRVGVDENTKINPEVNSAYGKNRFFLESFVRSNFPSCTIVRLPGLFGKGIKKNLIFDIIHDNHLELFNSESVFQFYNLDNIWKDIALAMENSLDTINFATEPTTVKEVFKVALDQNFNNKTEKEPVKYGMKTLHAKLYRGSGDYIYYKKEILEEIKKFVREEMK